MMYSEQSHEHPSCNVDWQQHQKGETVSNSSRGSRGNFHFNGIQKNFGRLLYERSCRVARGSYHRGKNLDRHHHHSFENSLHMGSQQLSHDKINMHGRDGCDLQHLSGTIQSCERGGHLHRGPGDNVNSVGRYWCYKKPRPGYGYVGRSRGYGNHSKFYHHNKIQTNQLKKCKRGGMFLGCFKRSSLKSDSIIMPFSEISGAKGHDVQSAALSSNSILESNGDHINFTIQNTGLPPSIKVEPSPLTSKSNKEETLRNWESSFLCRSVVPCALVAKKLQDGAALSMKDTTIAVKREQAFITCRNGTKRPRSSAIRDYPAGCDKYLEVENKSSSACKDSEVLDGDIGLTTISKEAGSAEIFQLGTEVGLVDGDNCNVNREADAAATGIQVCHDIVFENDHDSANFVQSNRGVSNEDILITNADRNEVLVESLPIGSPMERDVSTGRDQSDGVVFHEKAADPEDGLRVGGVEVKFDTPTSRNPPELVLEDTQVLVNSRGFSSNFDSSRECALQDQNRGEMSKPQGVFETSDNAGALVLYESKKSRASMKNKDSGQVLEDSGNAGALVPYQSSKNNLSMRNKDLGRKLLHKGRSRLKIYQNSRSLDGAMLEDPEKALRIQADGCVSARTLVKRTLQEFESLRKMLVKSQDGVKDGIKRADLDAGGMMKEKGKWRNCDEEKIVGEVPGVEVGDQFSFRMEMLIIGLHRQVQAGIDYIPASRRSNKAPLATSIVASGGYEDDKDDGNMLIYTGQGGKDNKGGQGSNQKLVRGNLALSNSMKEKSPVRVIRGTPDPASPSSKVYTYDGLYDVNGLCFEYGTAGYQVFHFTLIRRPGQQQVGLSFLSSLKKKGIARPHVLLDDISEGQERVPVCVVNEVDEEPAPLHFVYIFNMKYPLWYSPLVPQGCDCVGGCFDEEKCSCARKNGGEFPYNEKGYLIRDKKVVFECGGSCKCSNSCQNRVSQNGLRYRLEIFKTKNRGWGVRSLNSIQSGGFVCEYTGELLSDAEAEERVENDEYLFDLRYECNTSGALDEPIGVHGLSALLPVASDVAYTIDAKGMGNVARFINHSCSPNLYPQNVLYDSDDLRFPRVMLFAMENIPPMRELTYDYNYSLDHVRDAHGNVKMKPCYCGAQDCQGRLY